MNNRDELLSIVLDCVPHSTPLCYLLHYHGKVGGRAQHYIGFSPNVYALAKRLHSHHRGTRAAAAFTRAAVQQGIEFDLARVWVGGRNLERLLKNQKNAKRLCPVCRAEAKRAKELASGIVQVEMDFGLAALAIDGLPIEFRERRATA